MYEVADLIEENQRLRSKVHRLLHLTESESCQAQALRDRLTKREAELKELRRELLNVYGG